MNDKKSIWHTAGRIATTVAIVDLAWWYITGALGFDGIVYTLFDLIRALVFNSVIFYVFTKNVLDEPVKKDYIANAVLSYSIIQSMISLLFGTINDDIMRLIVSVIIAYGIEVVYLRQLQKPAAALKSPRVPVLTCALAGVLVVVVLVSVFVIR